MTGSARPGRDSDLVRTALTAALFGYAAAFVWLQTPHLLDTRFLEWDARAMALVAARFHGTGLLAGDLPTARSAAMAPPGWRAVYWLGTLAMDPFLVSKLLPFALLAVVLWQGYRFGARFGGPVLGAATVALLVHCNYVWDRIVGGNPRAFGFPLLVALVRYASEGRDRPALAALALAAACYPSVALVGGLGWGLSALVSFALDRDPARLKRRALDGVIAAAAALVLLLPAMLWPDPAVGRPPTVAQHLALRQAPFWQIHPLKPLATMVLDAAAHALSEVYGPPLLPSRWPPPDFYLPGTAGARVAAALLVWLVLALAAGRRAWVGLGAIFPSLALAAVLAFELSTALAYRLYLPERMLQYALPVVLLLSLPVLARAALARVAPGRASELAALLLVGAEAVPFGTGLTPLHGIHDLRESDAPAMAYLARLPADAVVAARLVPAGDVQRLARRKTLFSLGTDTPEFYGFALETERRLAAFTPAYYARDPEVLRRWARESGADYLLVDRRDFTLDAPARAADATPWSTMALELIGRGRVRDLVLAEPPLDWVIYRDGPWDVIDLARVRSGANG